MNDNTLPSAPRSQLQLGVDAFMIKAKQHLPDRPILPDATVCRFRARLILEEALETITALGFAVVSDGGQPIDLCTALVPTTVGANLVQIADGCADTMFVVVGTLSACGIADNQVVDEVVTNNLAKFGPGCYIDEHGKVRKPPQHKPPDLAAILKSQGWRPNDTAVSAQDK